MEYRVVAMDRSRHTIWKLERSTSAHGPVYAAMVLLALVAACGGQENQAPQIAAVVPATVTSLTTTEAVVEGAHFYSVAHFDIDKAAATDVRSAFQIRIGSGASQLALATDSQHLNFVVPSGLPSGPHSVTVETPDGQTVTLEDAITVRDDQGLQLSIEDASGGLGTSADGRTLKIGDSLALHAIGRRDSAFLDEVEVGWSSAPGGSLSEDFGEEVTFEATAASADATVSISHPIYQSTSIHLTVVECIEDSDCLDICPITVACMDGVCVEGPVDPDANCGADPTTTTLRFNNAGIAENLTKFPVLVTLTPANFDYALADPLGADLLFQDADGTTTLPHEIEVWSPGGTSQVWVLALQIDANSTTDHIFMTYGDMSIAPGEDTANLWDKYHAVYHLGETGDGTAGEFADSSPQNHHGQGGAGNASRCPVPIAGKIGTAQQFDGSNDRILVAPSDDFIFSTDAVSVSAWISSNSNNNPMVAVGKGGSPGGYRFGIESDGRVGWMVSGTLMDTALAPSEPAFHHIVLNWDGSTMRTYVDGVEEASTTKNGAMAASADSFQIGRGPSGFEFRGIIDEVRVLNQALSADWIAAQHRSTSNAYITFE